MKILITSIISILILNCFGLYGQNVQVLFSSDNAKILNGQVKKDKQLISFGHSLDFYDIFPLIKNVVNYDTEPVTSSEQLISDLAYFYQIVNDSMLVVLQSETPFHETDNYELIIHNINQNISTTYSLNTTEEHNFLGLYYGNFYAAFLNENYLYIVYQNNGMKFYKINYIDNEITSIPFPDNSNYTVTKVIDFRNNTLRLNALRYFTDPAIVYNVNVSSMTISTEPTQISFDAGLLKLTNEIDTFYVGSTEVLKPNISNTKISKITMTDKNFNLIFDNENYNIDYHAFNIYTSSINNLAFQASDSCFYTVSTAIPVNDISWLGLNMPSLLPYESEVQYNLMIQKYNFQGDLIWSDVITEGNNVKNIPVSLNIIGQDSLAIGVITDVDYFYPPEGIRTLLITPTITSVSENTFIQDAVNLFPNPCSSSLTIESKDGTAFTQFQILDLSGKIVKEGLLSSYKTYTVDTSTLQNGMYLLKVFNNRSFGTAKFAKE